MKSPSLSALLRSIKRKLEVIRKYHTTIIVVILLGILIAAVANVNAILGQPPDESYRSEAEQKTIRTNFDQATIDSINKLRERQQSSNLSLPGGRNNPFIE